MDSASDLESGALPEQSGSEGASSPSARHSDWQSLIVARAEAIRSNESTRTTLLSTAEVVFIFAWAVFFAREYLDFSTNIWPLGREFGMAIQTHYIWTLLPACGDCFLWNGFINGGSPAFAELHGAVLHPLVALPALVWGVINGSKVTIIGSLAMAGVGQWWLARAMKLGLLPRLWAGMMAVVGGHLAGKMEIGVVAMVLSTAAASLVIAAGVDVALTGRRRSAVLLGITLALAIVSGQGYIQIGLLFGIAPAFLVFLVGDDFRFNNRWREYALAIGIGLLLAGIFLVPMAHFYPNFGKAISPEFVGVQSFGNSVLNLVISDLALYRSEVLGTLPFAYQYITFVGWIPVLLAILTLRLVPRRQSRLLLFFFMAIVLVYLLASGVTLELVRRLSEDLVASVRIPSLIAGLAVPLVLGLAAWSADILLQKDWPVTLFGGAEDPESRGGRTLSFSLSWILVGVLMALSLRTAFDFSRGWLGTLLVDEATIEVAEEAVRINPPFTAWTEMPFGEHYWAPIALERGLKLTSVVRPWDWREREWPPAELTVTRDQAIQGDPDYIGSWGGTYFRENPENAYAFVRTETDVVPCAATAVGGQVEVTCTNEEAGELIVQEYLWGGWTGERDGEATTIGAGSRLNAEAPAGTHQYRFRYQPWDVYLGLAFTIAGIILCAWIWFFQSRKDETPPESM